MVNYSNGKIYKIECLSSIDPNDIYIGSTTKQFLSQRMDTHRRNYKCWLKGNRGNIRAYDLFTKYGIENCQITLIETCSCESLDALRAREGHFVRTMNCVNKNIPGRTHKEYREDNKEAIGIKHKEYYDANKEGVGLSKA